MVEPAWAVADIATSGSKSEIVRRCFVNMVRLHHCWKRVMCALLIMSSEQIVCRLQAHTDVKPCGTSGYQRDSGGLNAAPAKVQSTIAPPTPELRRAFSRAARYCRSIANEYTSRYLIVKGMMRS